MNKTESEIRAECKAALENVMSGFRYKKVEMFQGRSIIFGCSFYQTEIEKVFITDYDISIDQPLNDKTYIAFSLKTGKNARITIEFMEQAEMAFKEELRWLNTSEYK